MNQQVLSYFSFNILEIVLLFVFFLFFAIQLFFYFKYYKKLISYTKDGSLYESTSATSTPKVSVIIASENEAIHLAENLPAILEQDYPDFEVIVVNNGSTDESDDLLQSLKLRYSNLYHTYLPHSNDKAFGRRKLALTIGIKAAKGDILLFTEPYSRPISDKWISEMVGLLAEDKDITVGYSYYKRTDRFFNRIARFDNHLFSLQYLLMALKGKPFAGVYRNLAFKKHLFFDNKGFASYLHIENGEDVFINKIMKEYNVAVALSQDSFIETSIDNFPLWKQIKKSYSLARSNSENKATQLFSFEVFSRYLFYALFLFLLVYSIIYFNWALLGITVFLFLFRQITQLLILNKSAKYLHAGKFYFSLIVHDILQPIYNCRFKTRHRKLKGR